MSRTWKIKRSRSKQSKNRSSGRKKDKEQIRLIGNEKGYVAKKTRNIT